MVINRSNFNAFNIIIYKMHSSCIHLELVFASHLFAEACFIILQIKRLY